jgi:hypothetical protein
MNDAKLGRNSAGFALAVVVTVLFNTVLACAKDADAPLKSFMRSLAGHDWTTQGIADLVLFFVLGLIFSRVIGEKIGTAKMVTALTLACIVAGIGLAGWYLLY